MTQPKEFNPMLDVPTTDDEARIALRYKKSDLVARNLVGIFECQRALGETLIEAYMAALLAHVGEEK